MTADGAVSVPVWLSAYAKLFRMSPPRSDRPLSLIGDWRRLYSIKQAQLAREAGLHVITLSRIENGSEPGVTNAIKLCRALSRLSGRQISVEQVFYESEKARWAPMDAPTEALYKAEHEVHRAAARGDSKRLDS
jgi:DNA-binding XRE family transcriptional regulator